MRNELVVTAALILLSGCGSDLSWPIHDKATPSTQALYLTMSLTRAESKYHERYQRYGTLQELGREGAKVLSMDVADGEHCGYRFFIEASKEHYTIRAIPKQIKVGSERSFFVNQTGTLRQSYGPEPANAKSAQVK